MDGIDIVRRIKRSFDSYSSYKKTLLIIVFLLVFFFYIRPNIFKLLSHTKSTSSDVSMVCLNEQLEKFRSDVEEFNAHILHVPALKNENTFVPYVGNGIFGIDSRENSPFYIRNGRTLSLPVLWNPLLRLSLDSEANVEAFVLHYTEGVSYKFKCFDNGVYISHQHYAHRTIPHLLVQHIKVSNPSNNVFSLVVQQMSLSKWKRAKSRLFSFYSGSEHQEVEVNSGCVDIPSSSDVVVVAIVCKKVPTFLEVGPFGTSTLEVLCTVNYSDPIQEAEYSSKKNAVEENALSKMKDVLFNMHKDLKEEHVNVWQQLWSTGFSISTSKAADALNGDKLNATVFYVLSQVSSPFHETGTTQDKKLELANSLFYAEGCYGGFSTLQASNLWRDLSSVEEINEVVSLWLITLEKQGCHNLLKAGAIGVMQAIILSLGGLRFSNQHLEFNIHPKYLHRDYLFRRISYGNLTHVNISVVVQEDNKAVLFVALDRSDRSYYACGGGCVDNPVQLSQEKTAFLVKLTDPVTSILYITYDKQHMEDLRHAIHVKEIVEAPAHQHHVIALHRHGHHLGGLPALFWFSISTLIIIFHLFLVKLIYNEYCGGATERRRIR